MESVLKMKVAVTFKGSNYLVWSRMVKTAVGSKGLWKHITAGEAPRAITQEGDAESSEESVVEKWQQEDMMVHDGNVSPSCLFGAGYPRRL